MPRRIAILLLFLHVFSTTEACELLKLPRVWQHYREHRAGNGAIGFVDFLQLHYTSGTGTHDDHDRQLPFKEEGPCALATPVAVPEQPFLLLPPPVFYQKDEWPSAKAALLPSAPEGSVFQPPKAA